MKNIDDNDVSYAIGVVLGSGLEFLVPSRSFGSWLIFVLLALGTTYLLRRGFGK